MDWFVRSDEEIPEGLDVEDQLRQFFVATTPTLLTGLAIVFVVAAVLDLLLFEPAVARLLVVLLLVSAGGFAGLRWLIGDEIVDPDWARPLAALIGIAGVGNAALPVLITGDPLQGVWLTLLVVGIGMLLLPSWVLAGIYGASIGFWVMTMLIVPGTLSDAWFLMLHGILMAILVGTTAHVVRRRELTHVAVLRFRDEERTKRLEQEIEDRRSVEADLRRSQRRMRTILQNLPVILFTVDADERVTYVGGQGLEQVPVTREALVGEQLSDLAESLPVDMQVAIENTRRALAGESVVSETDYEGRVYEARYEPLAGDEIVALVLDVTERREAQLREMELERLKDVNRFKTDLLNSVSHELKTPLTPIRMQIHRLRRQRLGPINEEQDGALDVIDRNMRRLGRLVDDVLQVARGEHATQQLKIEPVDVPEVVDEMVDAFEIQAAEKSIDLQVGQIPEVTLPADRDRLVQILSNLVSNAVKYTPEGGEVSIEVDATEETVSFVVSDTGIGMTDEQMERIFDPFSRLHDAGSGEGTGLGLYITRQMVEAHDGEISVESPGSDKGTTFTVRLPRGPDVRDREAPGSSR